MFTKPARIAAAGLVLLACSSYAQSGRPERPQVSPKAMVMQRIGMTDVTITYHRPKVNNRVVWGELVPYDKVWRAGANDNTLIEFTDDVKIEGQPLPKGKYSFHIIPKNIDEWTLIFSKKTDGWGSFQYRPEDDALRVDVRTVEAPHEERLLYGFDDLGATKATAFIHWEKRKAPFVIELADHVVEALKAQ